jgi:RimJ/RimL family protein N-acetyltransferase
MIYQLIKEEYESIRYLYRNLRFNLVVDSIIDGNTPAWVFVDNKNKPQTAAIWNKQDAILLAGNDCNAKFNTAFGEQLFQRIIPDAQRRYIPEISLYIDPNSWENKFGVILNDQIAVKASRIYYEFAGLKVDWQMHIPLGCDIVRIDETLLGSDGLENTDQVVGWVRSYWRSNQDFVNTGFGYCTIRGKTILSFCLSVYVSGSNYELGIATVPEHRRCGFAKITALACVEHCVENGLIPHWHCWDDNLGSIAVAEKIGFENPTVYDAYKLHLG